MAITAKQRQARNMGVGASECASILGLDPWRTPYDLWLLKTERGEESGEENETEAQEIGNAIEDTTSQLAERRLGCRLVKPKSTYKAPNGIMFANLDRQVNEAKRGAENCELKSTGMVEGWGDAGSDEVPERVLIQVTAQMLCSDARVSHVAALMGRRGFSLSMYRVEFNAELARIIEDRVCSFWDKHVQADVPPEGLPSLPVITHVKRKAGKVIVLEDGGVITKFITARDARKVAEKAEEEAKAELLAALGDAEGAKAPGLSVSFKTVTTTRLDQSTLREKQPDIYSAFTVTSWHRRLDVREVKS